MKLWNRLRHLLASDGAFPQTDEAIFLTQKARLNHQSHATPAPQIRQRYFGADLRREQGVDAIKTRPGLLARLGLGLKRQTISDGQDYFGTRISGTPHLPSTPASTPAKPVKASAKPGQPSTEEEAVLESLFGKQMPEAPSLPGMQAKATTNSLSSPGKSTPSPAPATSGKEKSAPKKRRKMDRDDMTIAALGIVLAVTCALFPWYIFFNQEKFGVREFTFSGSGGTGSSTSFAHQPQYVGKPFAASELTRLELDFFPTATLPEGQEPARAIPASDQPFPADRVSFRLVHVANGRAMIEDEDGLWVVQRGSLLPDASHVAAIEQREGGWVLVTTTDRVVKLTR